MLATVAPRGLRRDVCVVTGAAGFLGGHIVKMLVDRGEYREIRAVDIKKPKFQFPNARVSVKCFQGNICELNELRPALQGADCVFHAAAIIDTSLHRHPLIDAVNIRGTENIINLCNELGISRLIYTSTYDVVFDFQPKINADESTPYAKPPFANDYVRTKTIAEQMVLEANGRGGLLTCAIRPGVLYGPEEKNALYRVVTTLRQGRLPFKLGPRVADARTDLTFDGSASPVAGNAYFCTEGNALSYWEFFDPYVKAKGLRLPERSMPYFVMRFIVFVIYVLHFVLKPFTRRFEPELNAFILFFITDIYTFSYAKATRDMGYKPLYSPDEARRLTIVWLQATDW